MPYLITFPQKMRKKEGEEKRKTTMSTRNVGESTTQYAAMGCRPKKSGWLVGKREGRWLREREEGQRTSTRRFAISNRFSRLKSSVLLPLVVAGGRSGAGCGKRRESLAGSWVYQELGERGGEGLQRWCVERCEGSGATPCSAVESTSTWSRLLCDTGGQDGCCGRRAHGEEIHNGEREREEKADDR